MLSSPALFCSLSIYSLFPKILARIPLQSGSLSRKLTALSSEAKCERQEKRCKLIRSSLSFFPPQLANMVSASSTLLLSIPRANVSYVHSGAEQVIGEFPLSLSVVNIPVTSSLKAKEKATEELDQWLLLALTKGEQNVFELPLAGTTRVISVPSPAGGDCYLIPLLYGDLERFLPLGEMSGMELGADSEREGGYLRLTLDGADQQRKMEEKEMLESILWGMTCSTFESQAPVASASVAGKEKAPDSKVDSMRNKLVLVDEESGKVIGEVETPLPNLIDPTSPLEEKAPVLIDLTTAQPTIRTLSSILSSSSESFKPTENPSGSTIITIGDLIGRGAIIGSEVVGWSLQKGAQAVVDNTKKTDKPLVFGEQTRKKSVSSQSRLVVLYSESMLI